MKPVPIPKFVEVGIQYGLVKPGYNLDDYLTEASIDPSGFECAVAHGQQGAGKSNYMLQRLAEIKKTTYFKHNKELPDERTLWNETLDSIVFTPQDFIEKLEKVQDREARLDAVLWDDIQLEYTSSTFKTNIDQYSAIDSMMAVIRTKCAITLITIPNITRLPKNVKDNITFEIFVGKNRLVQVRKIYRLPGTKHIDSNAFKPQIIEASHFNIYDVPPWAWKRYEAMRQEIANKALANLKEVTDMEDTANYTPIWEVAKKLTINANSLQQMTSRGVVPGKKVNGVFSIPNEFIPELVSQFGKNQPKQ